MPDKDFMIVSLDLLSGVTQGLGPSVDSLVAACQPPLVEVLSHCVKDKVAEVRQSAFALAGDLAISSFRHLKPAVPQLMPDLISNIGTITDPSTVSVCNNACWAIGEIALQCGAEMMPYIEALLPRLVLLLNESLTPKPLQDNVAITLGRLGLVCSSVVAPHLESFAENWYGDP
jgi:hypothetical protein